MVEIQNEDNVKWTSTESASVTDAGETADEIHAADAESAEELVVGWHLDVEAVLVGLAVGWPAAFLEFIAVQRIYRGGSFISVLSQSEEQATDFTRRKSKRLKQSASPFIHPTKQSEADGLVA